WLAVQCALAADDVAGKNAAGNARSTTEYLRDVAATRGHEWGSRSSGSKDRRGTSLRRSAPAQICWSPKQCANRILRYLRLPRGRTVSTRARAANRLDS